MSEHRQEVAHFTIKFADKLGTKPHGKATSVKIYPAFLFESKWEPASKLFHPRIPLHTQAREEKLKTLFRVKVGGKWHSPLCKYTLFTRDEIVMMWLTW